jgi:hypothetical protein
VIESTHDCGHLGCDTRQDPFHDHFLSPADCGCHERLAAIETAAAELRRAIAAAEQDDACVDTCSHCRAKAPDRVGLSLLETDELEAEDFGFCSLGCMVAFVEARYIIVPLAAARAAGTGSPSAVGDRPAVRGASREPVGSGKSSAAPGRSTSEAGATSRYLPALEAEVERLGEDLRIANEATLVLAARAAAAEAELDELRHVAGVSPFRVDL